MSNLSFNPENNDNGNHTASALSYLVSTEKNQPELMQLVLKAVLTTHPDLVEIGIPRFVQHLSLDDLKALGQAIPHAKSFIEKHFTALKLLRKNSPLYAL